MSIYSQMFILSKPILSLCCEANPNKAFLIELGNNPNLKTHYLEGVDLFYSNPLASPRALATKFFEIEIGKPANDIPSAVEISAAMADPNPLKRLAARAYYEAALKEL